MLTFFTTAKPFVGHSGVIQRNALRSWKLLHPDVEVILFGNEDGVAETCAELGLRHEPHVERHESGMKYLNYMFERAQKIATHPFLCYSNCDIVLLDDFWRAFETVSNEHPSFLMISQRWDTDIVKPLPFGDPLWQQSIRNFSRVSGTQQIPHFVDYFVFSKGLYDQVPPLLIGRSFWDWWLVWKALSRRAAVVDCTPFITAIHQNHGHGYHPKGKEGTNEDELAKRNVALAGNGKHLRYILDSNYQMDAQGKIHRVFFRRQYFEWKIAYKIQTLINITYPLRRLLGLRRAKLEAAADHKTRP